MSELHVLLVPDGSGSGPWHWQQWLAARLREAGAVVTRCPGPVESTAALRAELARVLPEAELAVVAHRGGARTWLRHAAAPGGPETRRADRVLLVAPAEPDVSPGRPGPRAVERGLQAAEADGRGARAAEPDAPALRAAGGPTRMVVGTDDPELSVCAAHALAHRLRVELDVLADGRALDLAAGYGPWPALLRWALYGSVPVADRFDTAPHVAGWSAVPEAVR
ncbi:MULTISPECIES: alpha/beta hydrolase [unclassified Saccharopolyspora]|uniref:RBBP9/YdeN family alpha/beta hydrolase n=1 Tax=unclassified Saccharopolyspora TaxID=2646250 RepID=UPI001CD1B4BB|nr:MULTISPECIES: alpha/beta hydrolase [unclassified Saccharopolyspora]MCA1188237.1 alpha/beta hydrolase [Saccharopolyspora sp. 6T]MCA1192695.1 alpha/beta hydrolase [Saccharopolyspora sp. 6V]MCA1280473.1 alpha/beta hydrolase [Saccharopolyspora sp. 7B]